VRSDRRACVASVPTRRARRQRRDGDRSVTLPCWCCRRICAVAVALSEVGMPRRDDRLRVPAANRPSVPAAAVSCACRRSALRRREWRSDRDCSVLRRGEAVDGVGDDAEAMAEPSTPLCAATRRRSRQRVDGDRFRCACRALRMRPSPSVRASSRLRQRDCESGQVQRPRSPKCRHWWR